MTPGALAVPLQADPPHLLVLMEKFGLILCRAAGLLTLFPLGPEIIPARVRMGVAMVLALTLLPLAPPPAPGFLPLQLCAEAAVGLLAALLARLPLAAVEAGLQISSVSAGLGIATLLNPATHEETHALTDLLLFGGLCLFFALGGHHRLIGALHESLLRVPPGGAHLSGASLSLVLRLGAELFTLAIQVAAPVLMVSLTINLAIALVARAAPAVNIFSVTLVGVLLGGLLALLRGLPVVFSAMRQAVEATPGHYLLGHLP